MCRRIEEEIEPKWPGQGFWVCVHCVLNLEDMTPRSRSWHTLGSWTTIVCNIIQIKLGSEESRPGKRFSVYVHCDLDIHVWDMSLGHGQHLCEIISRSNLAVWSDKPYTNFGMYALWPSLWRCDLGKGHDTTLGHGQQLWNIIQIQLGSVDW